MPHRTLALQLLSEYQPDDIRENQALFAISGFVKNNPDCFLREHEAGHLTASAWLLSPCGQKVLLTHHKKIGLWIQLGGHCDGDFDLKKVALKEAYEESGIPNIIAIQPGIFDVDIHWIGEHKNVPGHWHYDVRFLLQAPHLDFVVSNESIALAWVSINQLATDPEARETLARMARKSLQVIGKIANLR